MLQVIINVIDFNMPIADAVTAPRLHHQWRPDEVFVEPGFAPETLDALAARGHVVLTRPPASSANSIVVKDGWMIGAADPRTRGALAAGVSDQKSP